MKLIEPWLPEKLQLIEADTEYLLECKAQEEWIQEKQLIKFNAEEMDFSALCFSKIRFENCRFINCSFHKCEFTDVVFLSCNFSNCNFSESYWNRCQIGSSKGIGADFSDCSINHVTISGCSMDYSNFDLSKLEKVRIEQTELNHGSLAGCRCKELSWDRVQLKNASFFKTPLKGMDFSTSSIEGIVLSDECTELKGVSVDLYQAADLAKRMGIIIK